MSHIIILSATRLASPPSPTELAYQRAVTDRLVEDGELDDGDDISNADISFPGMLSISGNRIADRTAVSDLSSPSEARIADSTGTIRRVVGRVITSSPTPSISQVMRGSGGHTAASDLSSPREAGIARGTGLVRRVVGMIIANSLPPTN